MTIAPFLKDKVTVAGTTAIRDNSDIVAVLDGNGIVVVREDSAEGKKRIAQPGVVAERVIVSEVAFLVCNA